MNIQRLSLKTKYLILIFAVLTVMLVLAGSSLLIGIHKVKIETKQQVQAKLINSGDFLPSLK